MPNKFNRTAILNLLIKEMKYSSYLELGLETGINFRDINCKHKISVDPVEKFRASFVGTSDEFFKFDQNKYDLIFIDGLHLTDQVSRDIENSVAHLATNGTIVMHDCNPETELMQRVPRVQTAWNGDVWKSFVKFKYERCPESFVVDTNHGCGIIFAEMVRPFIKEFTEELNWDNLVKNRDEWLALTSKEQFIKRITERKMLLNMK